MAKYEKLQGRMPSQLFDITEEIRKLREIKDIEEELQMIDDVFVKQMKAIGDFKIALAYTAYNDAPILKALRRLKKDRDVIHQWKGDAKHEYSELTVLLDLKQKQANISEARSSRIQADQTARQGTIIMVFTIVTILFLPLSTLSSIFGLNAKELNGGNLSIAIVFSYVFPISLVVVVFACVIAFHNNAMLFSTLLLQYILEYVDLMSGFSHLFRDIRVDKMKERVRKLEDRKEARWEKSIVSDRGSAREFPFRGTFMRLFKGRSRSTSLVEV